MKKFVFMVPLISAMFLASCGGSQPSEFNVSTNAEGVSLSNLKAIKGHDFSSEMTLNAIGKILPNELNSVKSGNREILKTEYTYTLKGNKKADFKIPGNLIEGDVIINLSLLDECKALCFKDIADDGVSTVSYSFDGDPMYYDEIYYSYSGRDDDWTIWNGDAITIDSKTSGKEKIYVRNAKDTISYEDDSQLYRIFYFSMTGKIAASGNVNSLINYSPLKPNCFRDLFQDCDSLVEAPELPSTTLADSCYSGMFIDCTSLVIPPALPAETLSPKCYYYMFGGCTSLIKAPYLPAPTLLSYCYYYMFGGCESLTISKNGDDAHKIFTCPDTTGITMPVTGMFSDCKGATSNPTANTSYYWVE